VGIGTSSPESFGGGHKTLELSGSTNTEGGVFKTATSGSAGSGSTGTEMLMFTDSVGGKMNVVSSHPAIFYTANTERMRIDTSGNLLFNSGYGSVATAYGCRAWVNFNGTGTVAIRASGNVSSITDNGTGDYTVNFTNAMPDINYSSVFGGQYGSGAGTYTSLVGIRNAVNYSDSATTTSLRIVSIGHDGVSADHECVNVSIFR
jgi:hypothetical protein